jgi:hypothetical protein
MYFLYSVLLTNMPFIPVWKEKGYYDSLSEASKGQLNV